MSRDIFLGVGGSASSSIFGRYFFSRPEWASEPKIFSNHQLVIVMSGVDSGGSIGMQNDLFSLNNFQLNQQLHQNSNFPFQSYGDLKHFIIQSLHYKKPSVSWKEYLDFRSFSLPEHRQKYLDFSYLIQINPSLSTDFLQYLEAFFAFFDQHKFELDQSRIKPVCLGNLLLSFWHFKSGQINNLSTFLYELGLIPDWIEFIFASTNRTHLRGQDRSDCAVEGEHLFDEWQQPIIPCTHQIHNGDLQISINDRLLEILDNLKFSDQIIIPPGSDSNWLSLINQPNIQTKIRNKKILWIANLFKFTSETSLHETLWHLNSLDIYPEVFLPNLQFVADLLNEQRLFILKNYVFDEHKIPQVVFLPFYQLQIFRQLNLLKKTISNQDELKLIDLLLNEVNDANHFEISADQLTKMHYTIQIDCLQSRYMHSSQYAEQWLNFRSNPVLVAKPA